MGRLRTYEQRVPEGDESWLNLSPMYPMPWIQVSDWGRVRAAPEGVFEKYYRWCLTGRGDVVIRYRHRYMRVDRLVVAAHIRRKLFSNECVVHRDGNRENNRYLNLKLVRKGELVAKAMVGKSKSRWTEAQIGHLKYYASLGLNWEDVEWLYGGSRVAFSDLQNGKTYRHIPMSGPDPEKDFMVVPPVNPLPYETAPVVRHAPDLVISEEGLEGVRKSHLWTHRQIGHMKYYLLVEGIPPQKLVGFYGGSESAINALRDKTFQGIPATCRDPSATPYVFE